MLFCCLWCKLKLLVINTSPSFPAINTAAYYQQKVTTYKLVVRPHHIDNTWMLAALTASTEAVSESQFLPTPLAFDTLIRRVPVGILLCHLVQKNQNGVATQWWKNFEDTFIRFDRMYERDRHTNKRTPHDDIGRTWIVSHGKNPSTFGQDMDKSTVDWQYRLYVNVTETQLTDRACFNLVLRASLSCSSSLYWAVNSWYCWSASSHCLRHSSWFTTNSTSSKTAVGPAVIILVILILIIKFL